MFPFMLKPLCKPKKLLSQHPGGKRPSNTSPQHCHPGWNDIMSWLWQTHCSQCKTDQNTLAYPHRTPLCEPRLSKHIVHPSCIDDMRICGYLYNVEVCFEPQVSQGFEQRGALNWGVFWPIASPGHGGKVDGSLCRTTATCLARISLRWTSERWGLKVITRTGPSRWMRVFLP